MGCQLTVGHDTTEGIFAICCGEFAGDSCDGMVRQSNLECIFYKRSRADTEFSCLVISNQSYGYIPCEMIKVDWSDKLTFVVSIPVIFSSPAANFLMLDSNSSICFGENIFLKVASA